MVGVAAVAAVLVLGTAAWGLFGTGGDEEPKQTAIEPAEETSATTMPPVPGGAEGTASSTDTAEPGPSDTPRTSVGQGPSKVTFKLGNRLYVANDDGSEPISVTDAASSYTLSPDGRTLAVVFGEGEKGTAGTVTMIDTATAITRTGGRGAAPLAPAWAPDATWLAYTAKRTDGIFEVKGVGSDGEGDTVIIVPGALPAISSDSRTIAYAQADPPGPRDPLMVLKPGERKSKIVTNSEGAASWAWDPKGILYFVRAGGSEGQWQLWASSDGEPARLVQSIDMAPPAYALAGLKISPDGARIALSAIGDDNYSRLIVFQMSDSRFFSVPTRRDVYPARWTADGRILYFEGNSYQGESSDLMSILPDGTGRRIVVSGAEP